MAKGIDAVDQFGSRWTLKSRAKSWELLGVSIGWYLIWHAYALFALIKYQHVQCRMGKGESHLYREDSKHPYQTARIVAAQNFADVS